MPLHTVTGGAFEYRISGGSLYFARNNGEVYSVPYADALTLVDTSLPTGACRNVLGTATSGHTACTSASGITLTGPVANSESLNKNDGFNCPVANDGVTGTLAPTVTPTSAPTDEPTATPTSAPTDEPTAASTDAPTVTPTSAPTDEPTATPTSAPTDEPTATPTSAPTAPTYAPTAALSVAPTNASPPPLPPCADIPLNAGSSGYHRGDCWSKLPHADSGSVLSAGAAGAVGATADSSAASVAFSLHPVCDCGSRSDFAAGSTACYAYSSAPVCTAPVRPYVPGVDDGCQAGAFRCVVATAG